MDDVLIKDLTTLQMEGLVSDVAITLGLDLPGLTTEKVLSSTRALVNLSGISKVYLDSMSKQIKELERWNETWKTQIRELMSRHGY